jgi:hypothetical protein
VGEYYLLLLTCFVALGVVAMFLGIETIYNCWRKRR